MGARQRRDDASGGVWDSARVAGELPRGGHACWRTLPMEGVQYFALGEFGRASCRQADGACGGVDVAGRTQSLWRYARATQAVLGPSFPERHQYGLTHAYSPAD